MKAVFRLELEGPSRIIALFEKTLVATYRSMFQLPYFSGCEFHLYRESADQELSPAAPDSASTLSLQRLLEQKIKDGKKGQQ